LKVLGTTLKMSRITAPIRRNPPGRGQRGTESAARATVVIRDGFPLYGGSGTLERLTGAPEEYKGRGVLPTGLVLIGVMLPEHDDKGILV
jgi:hypothetical protein